MFFRRRVTTFFNFSDDMRWLLFFLIRSLFRVWIELTTDVTDLATVTIGLVSFQYRKKPVFKINEMRDDEKMCVKDCNFIFIFCVCVFVNLFFTGEQFSSLSVGLVLSGSLL